MVSEASVVPSGYLLGAGFFRGFLAVGADRRGMEQAEADASCHRGFELNCRWRLLASLLRRWNHESVGDQDRDAKASLPPYADFSSIGWESLSDLAP